jgi:hypothetical protein
VSVNPPVENGRTSSEAMTADLVGCFVKMRLFSVSESKSVADMHFVDL